MNVISQLPRWAQAPVRQLLDQVPVQGTETRPMDGESFQQSFQQAAGGVQLAALDEVPGEDQALGEPGLIKRNGATIYCQGDPSLSQGEVMSATLGRRGGREFVSFVHATGKGFATLQMINEDGSVDVHGSRAQRQGGSIQGYLLSGSFSA